MGSGLSACLPERVRSQSGDAQTGALCLIAAACALAQVGELEARERSHTPILFVEGHDVRQGRDEN
jgi:hypothetical protein